MSWGFLFPVRILVPGVGSGPLPSPCPVPAQPLPHTVPWFHVAAYCVSALPALFSTCSCGQFSHLQSFAGLFTLVCSPGISMGQASLGSYSAFFPPQKPKIFFRNPQIPCLSSFLAVHLGLNTILYNLVCWPTVDQDCVKSPEIFSVQKGHILDSEFPYSCAVQPNLDSFPEKGEGFVVGYWDQLPCGSMNYLWRASRRTLTAGLNKRSLPVDL